MEGQPSGAAAVWLCVWVGAGSRREERACWRRRARVVELLPVIRHAYNHESLSS